jgi:Flp pilus assembly protein TadB
MIDSSDHVASIDFSDREKLQMLENWFEKRAQMSSKALRFILIPVVAVLLFALVFWFQYYIPAPPVVLLGLLGGSIVVWIVCLFIGGGVLKKVRTGDTIMQRKVKSSGNQEKS